MVLFVESAIEPRKRKNELLAPCQTTFAHSASHVKVLFDPSTFESLLKRGLEVSSSIIIDIIARGTT